MGQHRCHGGNRTGGAPVRELPLNHGSHASLLHHHKHMVLIFREQRSKNINRAMWFIRGAKIDFIFVDCAARYPHLIRKGRQRIGKCQHGVQCTFFQQCFAYAEKHLSSKVRKNDAIFAIDDE